MLRKKFFGEKEKNKEKKEDILAFLTKRNTHNTIQQIPVLGICPKELKAYVTYVYTKPTHKCL